MKKTIVFLFLVFILAGLASCGEPGVSSVELPESGITPEDRKTVLINGVDVTEVLQTKTIDSILYAEAGSFIDSITLEGHKEWSYEHDAEKGIIYISSWATDTVIYRLYINSCQAERLVDTWNDSFDDVELGEPPVYQNGKVWLPVEIFCGLTGSNAIINE